MKKCIFIFLIFGLISCNQKTKTPNSEDTNNYDWQKLDSKKNEDSAKIWIENIFKTNNSNQLNFYLDKEEKLCTKRFFEFMVDSEEIFGVSNISEAEFPEAQKKYQEKWSAIYTLRKDFEPWLFGRGQDDSLNIKKIEVTKISNLKYQVFIDFGENQTESIVTLVKNENSFLIDYCETKFL